MNTQQSGGTPHTCKALEHCHQLNERVSDLEGWLRLVDGGTQRAHEDINALRELTNKMQGDAVEWHNRLAREWRGHEERLASLESAMGATQALALGTRAAVEAEPHCPTCFCDLKAGR